MSGFLTFVMGGRDLAAPLDQVREIIRAVGVEPLRGVRAPVTGLIELRGDPLPVVDLRAETDPGGQGDVVVMAPGAEGPVGIAVDRVLAVVEHDGFVSDPGPRPIGLPAYVLEVLRSNDEQNRPVLLVDLRILCGLDASAPPANAMS
jgi:purine-binding chemotaxis protein CheW